MISKLEQPDAPPIVIAGGGCVGLYLALRLCQSDIKNPVIVLEPTPLNPNDTKSMAHQPFVFPHFSRAGLMPELSSAGVFSSGICFRKSVARGSELIAGKRFGEGEMGQLLLPQCKFQDILIRRVREAGGELREGWKVCGFAEKGDKVVVSVERESGEREDIEAEYLVGADGAHSTVRKLLGTPFSGETLAFQLVATDLMYPFDEYGFYDANFVVDTEDYGLIGRIDRSGLWRVSYGVSGELSEEEIHRTLPEKIERLLPGKEGQEKKCEIKRVAPYKAQQRCAEEMWRGRVGLVGDAAHLTNPYAGLGLATGIMDASALADILQSVLDRGANESLLLEWASSRREKFLKVADPMSRAAFARVKSDPAIVVEKDPMLKAMKAGAGKPMLPPLATDARELKGFV